MKNKFSAFLSVLCLSAFSVAAQTHVTTDSNGNLTTIEGPVIAAPADAPPPSFLGGLGQSGEALLGFFEADTNATKATNWVAVPYLSYAVQSKTVGYGIGIAHPVNQYMLVGARLEHVDHATTAATVNLQVQLPKTFLGVTYIPFAVSGTGLEGNSVAAYLGAGAAINFHTWDLSQHRYYLTIGIVGDYEHWVNVKSATHINAGPSLALSF